MKMIGFGDMLVCLSTPGYERFIQADNFSISYSGAEANVCVSLARLGAEAGFVTRLPRNDMADCALATLRKYGVDTSRVVWGGERMGLLYMEKGASQRPSKVIYDRAHSAICECGREDFAWDEILTGADCFHFTGITAGLSDQLPPVLLDAMAAAKRQGALVSCDLNYRGKLWSVEKARKVMATLAPHVDVFIGNEEDAEKMLGIAPAHSDVTKGKLAPEDYVDMAQEICRVYRTQKVAFSLRESLSASDNNWSGMLYDGAAQKAYTSRKYAIHLVDRVGGGDAFSAGLLYGLGAGFDGQKTIDFAVAASCLKQTIEKDYNLSTCDEVLALMQGDASGRVQR